MARRKPQSKPKRSRKSGRKTAARIKANQEVLKKLQ